MKAKIVGLYAVFIVSFAYARNNSIPLRICIEETKVETVDDLIDVIESQVELIDNQICIAESKVDEIIDVSYTAVSKTCVIDSKVDEVKMDIITISSKVDVLNNNTITVESKIDAVDSKVDGALLKACTIESKVEIIEQNVIDVDSLVDIIDISLDTIESKIDEIDINIDISTEKTCTIASKVDVVDVEVLVLNSKVVAIDSKVDVVDEKIAIVNSFIDVNQTALSIVESRVDIGDSVLDIIVEKACTIESRTDVIDSNIDTVLINVNQLSSTLEELEVDFQETWTILQAIQDKSCIVSDTFDTIESKLSIVIFDLDGTFTALAALEDKVCIADSIIDQVCPCLTQEDFNGTYTMLNAMIEKTFTIGSKADAIDLEIEDIADNYGIPIFQEDVGTTGYTVLTPGRYFLAENIVFDPESSGLSAITINSSNVELSFLRRTISQTGVVNDTNGIKVLTGLRGIDITEASIRDFSGDGVVVESAVDDLFLRSFNIKSVGKNGIEIAEGCQTILVDDSIIGQCGGDGIFADNIDDLLIYDSMLTDNGLSTTNSGMTIANSRRVEILRSMACDNMGNGFSFTSTATTTDIVVNDCKAFENDLHGIFMSHIDDSVIINSVSNENGSDGIRVDDCVNIEIIKNYCSNNTDANIALGTESTGSSDCYVGENSLLLTGSVNVHEESGSGPNSILSNFALSVDGGNNYVTDSGFTYLNFVTVDQGGSFPATPPNKWYNISMTT